MAIKEKKENDVKAYQNLVEKIAVFAYPITETVDVDVYLDDFFGVSETQILDEYLSPEQEEYFWEWLWYDLPFVEYKTIVETYITDHEDKLSQMETEYLLGMQKSYRSCFEVLGIRRVGGLKVKDVFTQQEYMVSDRQAAKSFKKGDFIYARLIFMKGKQVFSGSCLKLKKFNYAKVEKALKIDHQLLAPEMSIPRFLKRHGGSLYQVLFDV